MRHSRARALAISLTGSLTGMLLAASAALAETPRAPAEGDSITFDRLDKLRPFLPPEFWDNRDFFFYEGMQLEIGPSLRDYSPADVYVAGDREVRGPGEDRARRAASRTTPPGQPFPMDKIDCKGDPQAGAKVMWNFSYRWEGDGAAARLLLLVLGSRRAAPALLRGHQPKAIAARAPRRAASTPTRRRRRVPRREAQRAPSASRWTRRSTRAASCC